MRRVLLGLLIAAVLFVPVMAHAQGLPVVRNSNMQTAATTTGNGNSLDTSGASSATVQYVGGSGVITIEASNDGTTWTTLPCYPVGNSSVASTFTVSSTPGMARCNVAAIALIRARISTFSSSPITVVGYSSSNPFAAANGF